MTKKLALSDEIKPLFDTDEKQIWDLILENNISELLTILPREKDKIIDIIIGELFSTGKSETLDSFDFVAIKEPNSEILRALARLIFALDINGNYEEIRQLVADRMLHVLPNAVKTIKEQSFDYPKRPINALVWAEGAGIRAALNGLVFYFRLKEDVDHLHSTIMLRTQITLAIMGHYKNLVGPDMIESARIKEQLGQPDIALGFYKAVKDDFHGELHWFQESPEMGPNEDDVVTLRSLKEALLSLDRINNREESAETCAVIDEILTREYVEEPDFNDDEED